jgi:hypothetical protein
MRLALLLIVSKLFDSGVQFLPANIEKDANVNSSFNSYGSSEKDRQIVGE